MVTASPRTQCRARISSLATYVPPRVLTNADLEKMVETSDEWILQRTGIRERHIVEPGVATSDLAAEAAKTGDRAGRTQADRHRLHRRRHDDAGHAVSEHGVPRAAQDRCDSRVGIRPVCRLLGIHLRADDRGADGVQRRQPARSRHWRRRHVEHHRLHRSDDLRDLRRWRWSCRRRSLRRSGYRHHRLRELRRWQRWRVVVHAGRRQPAAGVAGDDRAAAALREAGWPGRVQVRGSQHRRGLPPHSSAQQSERREASTCSSRIRRTAGSFCRRQRSWACRKRRS